MDTTATTFLDTSTFLVIFTNIVLISFTTKFLVAAADVEATTMRLARWVTAFDLPPRAWFDPAFQSVPSQYSINEWENNSGAA
jgi:hypothetical protein